MKISNSKKKLAKIIHDNGGWRDGAGFATQDQNATVTFFVDAPWRCGVLWEASEYEAISCTEIKGLAHTNWHQTILSRDEYFHLYPVAETAACEALGAVLVAAGVEPVVEPEAKPTIEQLAADYRNRKDYADRKQQEADAAKADAEAKLAELVVAGNALGLVLSVGVEEPVSELMITEVRDLLVGDEVRCVNPNGGLVEAGSVGVVVRVFGDRFFTDFPEQRGYVYLSSHLKRGDVVFIRRPAKGEANA